MNLLDLLPAGTDPADAITWLLAGSVVLLIAISGFLAGSETALMAVNRYRLRHLAKTGHRGARFAESLLERPDRLIGLILLLNNVVQALIPMLLLAIAQHLVKDPQLSIIIATVATALLIFIFSESMPKTLGAIHPERLALPAAFLYYPLVRVFQPVVWFTTLISNGLLRLIGVSPEQVAAHSISTEELRTVVAEAGALLPRRHRRMLLSILDLEKITVEDIMVPRNEIVGIDISKDWDVILQNLGTNQHTRLPVYDGGIDELKGIVHMRRVLGLYVENRLTRDSLLALAREPYYVPAGTPLNQQLVNFQHHKRRIGFVVDEYGDLLGLVTFEDILEEIVGDFTSDPALRMRQITRQPDDSVLVAGATTIRNFNRATGWKLQTTGPRTLNGLILEYLEDMPQPGTSLKIGDYAIEITEVQDKVVKMVRIRPPATAVSGKAS